VALGCEAFSLGAGTPVCAVAGAVSIGLGAVATAADVGLAIEGKGDPVNLALDALGVVTLGTGDLLDSAVKAGRMSEVTCQALKVATDLYKAPADIYSAVTSVHHLVSGD